MKAKARNYTRVLVRHLLDDMPVLLPDTNDGGWPEINRAVERSFRQADEVTTQSQSMPIPQIPDLSVNAASQSLTIQVPESSASGPESLRTPSSANRSVPNLGVKS